MNRNIYPRGYKRDTSTPGFYFNSYPDNSHLTEVGLSYERFIAGYYEETVKDSIVVHQGVILGKADSGIDLVVVSKKATYLIQCKRYRSDSLIHSNVVSQLFGDANMFKHKFPEAKNVTPVVVANCGFADDAIENAQVNGIVLKQLPYKAPYHYPGSGYISKIDSDYSLFLKELLIEKQHPELAKPAPVVHPAVKPDQTPPEPSQPPIVSNQPVFRDESSGPYTESVFRDELDTGLPSTPRKTNHWVDPTVKRPAVASEEKEIADEISPEKERAISKGFLYFLFCYPPRLRKCFHAIKNNWILLAWGTIVILAGICGYQFSDADEDVFEKLGNAFTSSAGGLFFGPLVLTSLLSAIRHTTKKIKSLKTLPPYYTTKNKLKLFAAEITLTISIACIVIPLVLLYGFPDSLLATSYSNILICIPAVGIFVGIFAFSGLAYEGMRNND